MNANVTQLPTTNPATPLDALIAATTPEAPTSPTFCSFMQKCYYHIQDTGSTIYELAGVVGGVPNESPQRRRNRVSTTVSKLYSKKYLFRRKDASSGNWRYFRRAAKDVEFAAATREIGCSNTRYPKTAPKVRYGNRTQVRTQQTSAQAQQPVQPHQPAQAQQPVQAQLFESITPLSTAALQTKPAQFQSVSLAPAVHEPSVTLTVNGLPCPLTKAKSIYQELGLIFAS